MSRCILGDQCQEQWWQLYKTAILETNWDKLEDHIKAAEEAIAKRVSLNGDISPDERVQLEDARIGLLVLKQEHRDSLSRGLFLGPCSQQAGDMSKPTLLLADDHPNFLQKVENLLGGTYEVVGRVGDGQALVEAAKKLEPDVIVTDISMPILNGIEAVTKLKECGCKAKVVFVTVHSDPDFPNACFLSGALGYVVKARMTTDLVPAVQAALAGHIFASPNRRFQNAAKLAL